MTYQHELPKSFPYCYQGTQEWVHDCLDVLIAPDNAYENGSSFAVTADAALNARFLWLSNASRQRLVSIALISRNDEGNVIDVPTPDYD